MMAPRRIWGSIFIVGLLLASIAAILSTRSSEAGKVRHVFINETTDHRFDESVKVSILAAYKRTGVQNAVVITDQEQFGDISKEAARLFEDLKLGRASQGRAILYLFHPQSHSLKIEVGYALEGLLPDVTVQALELAAKSFTYVDRYQDFWAELINTINIHIQKGSGAIDYDFTQFRFTSGGAGISSASYSGSWDQFFQESNQAFSEDLKEFSAQTDPDRAVGLYLESLRRGVGGYDMDLLTKESRLFRRLTPQTSYQMFRNYRMATDAGIEKMILQEPLAFCFFKAGHPVLPIVLKLEDGYWRVHEPLAWSLFQRFEDSTQVFLKYPISGLDRELDRHFKTYFRNPVFDLQKPLDFQFLQKSPTGRWDSDLIHLYWLERAELKLKKAEARNLTADDLMMAADLSMNLGKFSAFLEFYQLLALKRPDDLEIHRNLDFYQRELSFSDEDWILKRSRRRE